MTNNKTVSKKKESNVIPFDIASVEADAGLGMQNITTEDLALPFLRILTAEKAEEHDAKGGDIYNSVTQEVFSKTVGIKVVPCIYQRRYIEWAPRDSEEAGAPINFYTPAQKASGEMPKTERRLDPDGKEDYTDYIVGSENYLENTAHHYVIMLKDDGRIEPGLITMAKTAKKKSEKWNSMMTSRLEKGKKGHFNPPSFYYVYHLTTEKAAKGNYTWNTWNITLDGKVESADTYNHCKIFAESVEKGQVTANHEREEIPVEKDAGEAPF